MNPLMHLQNVSLQLFKSTTPILENINLSIYPGDSVVILGGNGSGKSSLMKLMNGHYQPTSGELCLKQLTLKLWQPVALSKSVATITQDPTHSLFLDLTVFENCLLFESRQTGSNLRQNKKTKRKNIAEYLSQYHGNLNHQLDQPVAVLSGGEKQALLLALLMRHPPELLLLDEHTSALDPHQAKQLMTCTEHIIQKCGVTTLMITHNLDQALSFGTRILALKAGQIIFEAAGSQKSKLCKEDLLQFCY